jgi:hypothetical protein
MGARIGFDQELVQLRIKPGRSAGWVDLGCGQGVVFPLGKQRSRMGPICQPSHGEHNGQVAVLARQEKNGKVTFRRIETIAMPE